MANISAITLPNNSTYDLTDSRVTSGVYFATCSTEASVPNKIAVSDNFDNTSFVVGASIFVKFTYASCDSMTLNINGTGQKNILYNSSTGGAIWQDGAIVQFVYDGTQWIAVSGNLGFYIDEDGDLCQI